MQFTDIVVFDTGQPVAPFKLRSGYEEIIHEFRTVSPGLIRIWHCFSSDRDVLNWFLKNVLKQCHVINPRYYSSVL